MIPEILLSELAAYDKVVLANGDIPDNEIPLNLLQKASQIVCCDGAVDKLTQIGIEPAAIVGDCDSISPELFEKYSAIIHCDRDIEYNDLSKSLRYFQRNNVNKVAVLGASGLRDDHALANLGIVMMFADEDGMDLCMVTNYGIFTPIFKTTTFNSFPGQAVSIFSFSDNTPLTFQGLKYPVKERIFKHLWEGSLNEAVSDQFTVAFLSGKVFVYRTFGK